MVVEARAEDIVEAARIEEARVEERATKERPVSNVANQRHRQDSRKSTNGSEISSGYLVGNKRGLQVKCAL